MAALIEGRAALIVIDMQQGYSQPFEQAGIPLMADPAEQVDRVVGVVDACRAADVPVVFTQVDLDAVAARLNTRPRKTLEYQTLLLGSRRLLHRPIERAGALRPIRHPWRDRLPRWTAGPQWVPDERGQRSRAHPDHPSLDIAKQSAP